MAGIMDMNHRMISETLKEIEKQLTYSNLLKSVEIALTKYKLGLITVDEFNNAMRNIDKSIDETSTITDDFIAKMDFEL